MPTKAEIQAELEAIKSKNITPGKWVKFESTPDKNGRQYTREGKVSYVDVELESPHASPVVTYVVEKDGVKKEFKNRPSKLAVLKAPHHH